MYLVTIYTIYPITIDKCIQLHNILYIITFKLLYDYFSGGPKLLTVLIDLTIILQYQYILQVKLVPNYSFSLVAELA